jgi:hypothetical protein
MKTQLSIDIPSGAMTRTFAGAAVPPANVPQFVVGDIMDLDIQFTAGSQIVTDTVLAGSALLKVGLRVQTSDGPLLAVNGPYVLANGIATTTLSLSTAEIQALIAALPDSPPRSVEVYLEVEVSSADADAWRLTVFQQQVRLLGEVNMSDDEPPPAAAASAATAEAYAAAAAESAAAAAASAASIPAPTTLNSTHASTNDAGDLTIAPTSRNHTEVVAVTGSARDSNFILATADRSAGDRLTVLLDLTDAESGIALTPVSGATALLPAGLFPGQVFRTSGIAVPVAFAFVFDGTDWVFVAASDTPTQIKTGGVIIPTNYLGEGTAIDFDFRSNSKTIAADGVTLTVSGSPAAGAWTRVEIINSDNESDHAVGIPSSTTLNSTAAITSVTLKAGGRLVLSFEKTASGYNVYGDPPGAVNLASDVTGILPASSVGGWPVVTDATTARMLALTDDKSYLRFTSNSAITVTVPKQATVAWLGSTAFALEPAGDGTITAAGEDEDVTINTETTLSSAGRFATMFLIRVDENVWTLVGGAAA